MANKNENLISPTESDNTYSDLSLDEIENALTSQMEDALADLELLEEERKNIANPESLANSVKDQIFSQISSQFGLDLTNETLIQKYDREHPEEKNYDDVAKRTMQDKRYKDANKNMKDKQASGDLVDSYSGEKIKQNDKANLDHTVSRKEIYENQRRKQAGLSTEDLANREKNLNPTTESTNKSKKDKSVKDYNASRKENEKKWKDDYEKKIKKIDNDPSMSAADKKVAKEKAKKQYDDKLKADPKKMADADKVARKDQNKEIFKGAAKNTAKKATTDALKVMMTSALMDLTKEILNGLIRFFKSKKKSFEIFLNEMKASLKSFFSKIKNFLSESIKSAVGTIVTEIFGPIVSTFKKLASFLKQGINSLLEAINFLKNKENRKLPFSIKVAEVGKIVTAGLATAGGIVLGEVIEKALLAIPGFATPIPLLGTLANIIGNFLGGIVAGIVGAIVLHLIDKFIENEQKAANTAAQIQKRNEVLNTQNLLNVVATQKAEVSTSNLENSVEKNAKKLEATTAFVMSEVFSEKHNELLERVNANNDELSLEITDVESSKEVLDLLDELENI